MGLICLNCGAEIQGGNKCKFCGSVVSKKQADDDTQKRIEDIANECEQGNAVPDGFDNVVLDYIDLIDVNALYKLGLLYTNNSNKANNVSGFKILTKCANKGNSAAMFSLGRCYEQGIGTEKDLDLAIWWYTNAARRGNIEARNTISNHFRQKIALLPDEKVFSETSIAGTALLKDLVGAVRPSCVELCCTLANGSGACGSGVILASNLVITNAHVVSYQSNKQTYIYPKITANIDKIYDKSYYSMRVLCYDVNYDIAICAFTGAFPSRIERPHIISVQDLQMGEEVFTIGNALGLGLGLSRGVIAKNVIKGFYNYGEILELDISINHGNSGGALFDMHGHILGLVSASREEQNNQAVHAMGYAITGDTILKFAEKNSIILQ